MDTIEETTEPVGSDGATPSPDTSATDAQPSESTDSVSDGEVVEEGEPEVLLAGKYKTPEELEKAYSELQSKFGEVGQKAEVANLLEKQTGMNAQQIKDYISQQEQARMQEQIQNNPLGYVNAEVQQLKNKIALQAEEKELDKFLSSEEGKPYAQNRDKIFQLGLNLAKDKSYADIAKEWFGETRAQGQQDAYKKIEGKIGTQATGASQAAPKSRLTPEDMKNMTTEELEAVLPWADISQRPY
jgi:hypothetical protein